METVIAFIIIFGALVFFHELGHLLLAKRAGILCREFAIGMGPKVFTFSKNETLYTIRLLPIGGYVRMAGEDPEMIEIKPGHNIGLLFNRDGKINKIVLNNKDKYPDLKVIEVEEADLEHNLFISGYEDGEDEHLKRYEISEKAFFVVDGQETQIAPYNRQFASKTLLQRTLAIAAGPAMNFILAFIILIALGLLQGTPIDKPILGEITKDGAALQAGLQEGDIVREIDNEQVSTWKEIVTIIQAHPDEEIDVVVERDGELREISVTPKAQELEEDKTIGIIGVYGPVEKSVLPSLKYGVMETFLWTKEILLGLGKLVTGQFSIDMLSGPVGIYVSTDTVVQSGIFYVMKWAAILSINLGIVNLLPLPALDGGRLVFFAVEAVRGKPIDKQKEGMVHFIGFALLMLLMLVVTWNDIQRFFL
ncbi:RIP metalloprotease RseP [Ferdinandcohnia sp. Marseille-Q9671]